MISIRVKPVCLIAVLTVVLALAPAASAHGVLAATRDEQGAADATAAEHHEFDRQAADLQQALPLLQVSPLLPAAQTAPAPAISLLVDSSLSIYQAAGTFANLPTLLTVFLLLLFGVIGYFAIRRRLDQDSERSLADTEEMSGSAQSLLQTLNDAGLTIPLVLALVLLLLPYALGTLLLPFVVPYLIMAFFHVVQLYPDARVRDMATGHYRLVVFVVELGVWWSFFTTLQRIFTPFWYGVRNLYYSSTLLPIDPYLDLLINWSWTLLPLLAAAIAAFLTTPSVADMVWEEFFPQEIDAEDAAEDK